MNTTGVGRVFEDPLQFRLAAQTVDPQLDQVDSGVGRLLPFLEKRRMPAPPNRYADHDPPRPARGSPVAPPHGNVGKARSLDATRRLYDNPAADERGL